MLRGMGFDNNTSIYLASGKIYKEKKQLAPLLEMFPKLYTKETLVSQDELAPFKVSILLAFMHMWLRIMLGLDKLYVVLFDYLKMVSFLRWSISDMIL